MDIAAGMEHLHSMGVLHVSLSLLHNFTPPPILQQPRLEDISTPARPSQDALQHEAIRIARSITSSTGEKPDCLHHGTSGMPAHRYHFILPAR